MVRAASWSSRFAETRLAERAPRMKNPQTTPSLLATRGPRRLIALLATGLFIGCATLPAKLPGSVATTATASSMAQRVLSLGPGLQFLNPAVPDNAVTPEAGAIYSYARVHSANPRSSPVGIELWVFAADGAPLHGRHEAYLRDLYKEIYGWSPAAWEIPNVGDFRQKSYSNRWGHNRTFGLSATLHYVCPNNAVRPNNPKTRRCYTTSCTSANQRQHNEALSKIQIEGALTPLSFAPSRDTALLSCHHKQLSSTELFSGRLKTTSPQERWWLVT